MVKESDYRAVKDYLNSTSELSLDQTLLKILMSRPNISFQTIEVYFDRDPDYRITYYEVLSIINK